MTPLIEAARIEKKFGSYMALKSVDLAVEGGSVLALLGRNGAGKTTFVRILSTLLSPDGGRATIAGVDVARDPSTVRSLIGLAGQFAAVDDTLTGRENLELVGRLYGLRRKEARSRADEVLERLSLTDAGDALVRTYSGGMRRRLDLGASLVGRPLVLIMDEPSTGLDPRSRMELWRLIEELVEDGTTLLLTTQYLEEADRLAHRVALIDRGNMIAEGTPDELKQRVGGDVLEVRANTTSDVEKLVGVLDGVGSGRPVPDLRDQRVTLPTSERVQTLLAAARRIEDAGIAVADLSVRRPSLDDVFLNLTSAPAASEVPRSRPGEATAPRPLESWQVTG
ncbi:ATP-binding cassette domain-containing protein [Candidatus Solirubrobacter pratensis]|uniref:ATP-binding cassette domain-containing protein n=1 Tax=Candidatus Solirubrobacter pratensis TaxID=1298857 RepID=UPI0003FA7EE2|nr:ATP-binding cassette domain-containing protein [Candidatus Solirubrobacter pratensis]